MNELFFKEYSLQPNLLSKPKFNFNFEFCLENLFLSNTSFNNIIMYSTVSLHRHRNQAYVYMSLDILIMTKRNKLN